MSRQTFVAALAIVGLTLAGCSAADADSVAADAPVAAPELAPAEPGETGSTEPSTSEDNQKPDAGVGQVSSDGQPDTAAEAEAEAEPEPDLKPEPEPNPEPEPKKKPKKQPQPEAEAEAEPKSESDAEPEPEPEPVLQPGPPIWGIGSSGEDVRALQARLRQIRWFNQDPTGYYGTVTAQAVSGFQAKRGFPIVGYVDQRTWDRIVLMTYSPTQEQLYPPPPEPEPGPRLHPACTTGRAICIDKTQRVVRWVIDGKTLLTLDARFGSNDMPTREGIFSVHSKVRDETSDLYDDAPMPLAVYFSGGQAVHYSPDFAYWGYNRESHGCVNTRSWDGMSYLFDNARIGDRVVVYRS